MHVEDLRAYCIFKKGVEESFPFGNETLVLKVGGKIFLLVAIEAKPLQFNAKCDPALAVQLRERYSFVIPGYHMNKTHWNTIICDTTVSQKLIFEWIDNSYNLVLNSLPKKMKDALLNQSA